ncbi:MAG: hypothetical protein IKH77_03035 [Clostridia bacterium]|nr:hypothetical protein [Clostridia bacterium]
MESIIEWAASFDRYARNKPNKQLQEELFQRVITALKEGTNTYDECVTTLCRFDAKVIEPFYRFHYWDHLPDRAKWDDAMLSWADDKKPSVPATIRIALILQEKLWRAEAVTDVLPELRWLSLHEDDRTIPAIRSVKEKSKSSNLRKLLALDMSEWKAGKQQIAKLFGILFADATDPETKASYQGFLTRNELRYVDEVPESKPQSPSESSVKPVAVEAAVAMEGPSSAAESQKQAQGSVTQPIQPVNERDVSEPKTAIPAGGVALAEAMLRWVHEQTDRAMTLSTRLADTSSALQHANSLIETHQTRIDELEQIIEKLRQKEADLLARLQEAQERITLLDKEKAAAQDTIGRVQAMTDNSVRQELEGFKHSLAAELSSTFKDFSGDVSDFTDAEKAEVYHALMEEVLDTLRHNGIAIEET